MKGDYISKISIIVLSLVSMECLYAQPKQIRGQIRDIMTKLPLQGVQLSFKDNSLNTSSDSNGKFVIGFSSLELDTLSFTLPSHESLSMPVDLRDSPIDLGTVYMRINLEEIQKSNQMILIEEDIGSGIENLLNTGVLGANRDLLVKRAAFDLGQAFFKIRGYDSRNGFLLINGIPMNRMLRGRPQWSNWGGLNDVLRNQEYFLGLRASPWHFGDVLGVTNIETRPGSLRPGFRFSSSLSNKTYSGRIMLTYNAPPDGKGLGYTISGSGRWAKQGFIDGTAYDAYSIYGALEYQFDLENSLYITGILASNIRGRNAPITKEIYELAGRDYNPYWGIQADEIRNSRIRQINEPILMLNYFHRSQKIVIESGIAYQWGTIGQSRIGYYNAPNPNPDYYRNLPSFYINSPIGANLISAASAAQAFQADPQLNWPQLYQVNRSPASNGKASYILYNDIVEQKSWRAHSNLNIGIGLFSFLDLGFNFADTNAAYFSRIKDLLGADYHEDIDPFSETVNQLDAEIKKKNNEIFGYHYLVHSRQMDVFAQLRIAYKKLNGFLAGKYYTISYQREGLFRNERYPEISLGLSERLSFSNYGIKGGISYEITKRHRIEA
ncbi:MAG: TonB-dependent receptor, partial [Flavobacteriaceae bacterium]